MICLEYFCIDWFSPFWIFIDDRHILITIDCQREGPWNRSCCHIEHMRMACSPTRKIGLEDGTFIHAKSMLFIDHHISKLRKLHIFLNQCVCPKDNIRHPICETIFCFFFLLRCECSDEQITRESKLTKYPFKSCKMLSRENLGRRHDSNLRTCRMMEMKCGKKSNDRLACAHIALQKSVHRIRRFHILEDRKCCYFLFVREFEWDSLQELLHIICIEWYDKTMSLTLFLKSKFFLQSSPLITVEFSIAESMFCALIFLKCPRRMYHLDRVMKSKKRLIRRKISRQWIIEQRYILKKERYLLSKPRSWNIVHIAVEWANLAQSIARTFDLRTHETHLRILIFWLAYESNLLIF